jgi:hypothetical protein
MLFVVNIHWKLRKGLGPEWTDKVTSIGVDDLPEETTAEEGKQIAIEQFKTDRLFKKEGNVRQPYLITDVCIG